MDKVKIYVDCARIPAKIGSIDARWSHLIAIPENTKALVKFGEMIGLKKSWLQTGTIEHFDVTENKRKEAIRSGAIPINRKEYYKLLKRYFNQRKEDGDKSN